ncbi:hypothetical protein [Microbacterium resistens]|uniref:hypothetical protein n=1 Tax=Microbacterium resistens TaxID=156977 RepID=UPI003671DDC7
MNREQLIEKAAKAIDPPAWTGGIAHDPRWADEAEARRISAMRQARAALAVFEEAHAPSAGEHFHIWSDLPCKPGQCRMEPHAPTEDEREAQGWREAELYAADTVPSQRAEVMDDFMTGWRTADRTRRTVQAERPSFDAFGEPRNRATAEARYPMPERDDYETQTDWVTAVVVVQGKRQGWIDAHAALAERGAEEWEWGVKWPNGLLDTPYEDADEAREDARGVGGQVFRRRKAGPWVPVDQPASTPGVETRTPSGPKLAEVHPDAYPDYATDRPNGSDR